VILPLMTPALVAGGALAFVSAIGNFGIPALLGIPGRYPVLSTLIYQRLFGFGPSVLPEVASVAMILAAMALVGIFIQSWIVKRHDYRVVGAAAVVLPYDLGPARIPLELVSRGIIFVTLVLPLFALVQASFLPAYGIDPSFSNLVLTHYDYVLFGDPDTLRAVINSFALALGAAVALVVLATPFSYFMVWKPNLMVRFTNFAAEIPYAVPGTVVAIGAILVFLPPLPGLGFSLYNTIWIIFAAYLTRFLNRALRPIISSFQQIDRTLDEAAAACGAQFGTRMRTILLPLVGPAAMGAILIVFLAAFNELTVSALLWSAGNETVGVMIFNLKDGGDTLEASAMAVVVLAITFVLMTLLSLMHGIVPKGVIPWRD
jgi:iron(III) transport system permease protein